MEPRYEFTVQIPLFGYNSGIEQYAFFTCEDKVGFTEMYRACAYLCPACLDSKKNIREQIFHDESLRKCYKKCPICLKTLEKAHDVSCDSANHVSAI